MDGSLDRQPISGEVTMIDSTRERRWVQVGRLRMGAGEWAGLGGQRETEDHVAHRDH